VDVSNPIEQISSQRWRNIGPHRGGRSVAAVGHPTDPATFYFGSTGGGVWQTVNAGITWRNVSDGFFTSASVGAIAIAPSDPNVLYVGTGEACIRSNVSYGDGVYRSDDAGRTWRNVGLAPTRHIARVRIDPRDPDRVYVAALGHAFGPNPGRGVYRTSDGGRTWERVLFVSEDTGAIDLSMDPFNPRVLYAAMWQGRRRPWRLDSGGPESGLFRSVDGGDTWRRLGEENGLPSGIVGRIGVSASGARRDRVWAMVEAERGGVFRSDDGGEHFTLVTDQRGPRSRPWYYSHVFADPHDENTVYVLAAAFWRSIDAGKTFTEVATPHGDHHDLWLDPARQGRMIHAADGGAAISFDGGDTWSSIHNQPTAELYHVTTDSRWPYRVYGAQQDNTTICVPSASVYPTLDQRQWYAVGGAESGYIAVRPDNPDIVYAGSSGFGEGGRLTRYDHRTGQLRDISVWPEKTSGLAAEAYTYRFQWTSPLAVGLHDANVLYSCGNRVFRSTDEGQTWQAISPDLTRNDPDKLRPTGGPITIDQTGAEIYCTVFSFAESPVHEGTIWVGSDDGLVHVTRDGGASWQAVTPPDLPEWALVSIIEASHHDAETAYLAANRYKLDDTRPYLWRTHDAGRTWQAIVDGLPADVYTRTVREDPEVPGLLYCGTERGVFVSFDDGGRWHDLRLNLPVVPVHDLAVKGTDLVAATHGRSFWILDDITTLRQLARGGASRPLRLFPPRATVRTTADAGGFERVPAKVTRPVIVGDHYVAEQLGTGDPPIYLDAGQNAPGVIFQYWLEAEAQGEITLVVTDGAGREALRRTSAPAPEGEEGPRPLGKAAGSHRFVWDMRYPGATPARDAGMRWPDCAPLAPPGVYTATLTADGRTERCEFSLLPPPDTTVEPAALAEQFALLLRLRDRVDAAQRAFNEATAMRVQIGEWKRRLEGLTEAPGPTLAAAAAGLFDALGEVRDALVQWRCTNHQDQLNYPPGLAAKLAHLFDVAASADARPTSQTYGVLEVLDAEVDQVLGRLAALKAGELTVFGAQVAAAGLPLAGA
jgi:photosystem II stability/assembly factor-like uncharacterized protein